MEGCNDLSPLSQVLSALGAPGPDSDLYEVILAINKNTGIEVQDSTTVQLEGDGTSSRPLVATLTDGAIQSDDGSILVERLPDGTFNITTEVEPSDVTVSGSTSIDVTETPGNPTDYAVSLSPNALIPSPDPSMIPVVPTFIGGQYQLGILSSSLGIIPRTVVVGGKIGDTPNAMTIAAALSLLPANIPVDQPWTLLFLPGTYSGPSVFLPLNVNLVALMRGSVTIDSTVNLNGTFTTSAAIVIDGLKFTRTLSMLITMNGGASYRGLIIHCTFAQLSGMSGPFVYLSASPSNSLIVVDNCLVEDNRRLILGGYIRLQECVVEAPLESSTAYSTSNFIDIENSNISNVSAATLSANRTMRITRTTLSDTWDLAAAASYATFYSCTALPSWVCNGRFQYYDSRLRDEVTKTSPTAYTVTSTNIGTSGGVDRSISALLDNIDLTVSPIDITVTLDPPLLTPFTAAPGVIPYTTTGRSTIQVSSGADQISIISTSLSSVTLRLTGSGTVNAWINILPPLM